MPGIYGFHGVTKNPAEVLRNMSASMRLYPHFVQDVLFEDVGLGASRVHLGHIGLKASPIVNADGMKVWVEGEVYNLEEVLKELGWYDGPASNNDFAAWVLNAYAKGQLDPFLNQIDGYFCVALYDPLRQKLVLLSDRYGMRMLYWYCKAGVFVWGSEVKAVLAVPSVDKSLDPSSLACFMDLGFLLGEHTWFEHIKLIKPASILEYDVRSQTIAHRYYWQWSVIRPATLSFDDAVDELGNRFIKAVARRFNPEEKIGISLSGGLDSRAIYAAVKLLHPGYQGHCYTFGIPGCDDITIAQKVLASSQWQHHQFHFTDENWFKPRTEMIWNTDGMLDMRHMHGGEFIRDVANFFQINLNGYSGDAVVGGSLMSKMPRNERANPQNIKLFFKHYGHLINISDGFYDIDKCEPIIQMNRVRRFTCIGTVNSLIYIDQRKPFFDNNIIELIYSLPDEYRLNNRLYAVMLQKYFPEYFATIPWQKTGKPAGINKPPALAMRALNKALRILNSNLRAPAKTIQKDYTNYADWIRSSDVADNLKEILDPRHSLFTQMSHEDACSNWLLPHLADSYRDNTDKILRAATIEIYFRLTQEKQGHSL